MKAVLISVGSRGDAEPFCSLARTLCDDHGVTVELFVQADQQYLVPSASNKSSSGLIKSHALPFTGADMYRFLANPTHGADDPNPRVRFIGIVTDVIGELVFPCWEAVLEASKDADVIVCSSLARPLSLAIAQKAGIKTAIIHLQPLMPTKRFPQYSNLPEAVKYMCSTSDEESMSDENEKTYWDLEKVQYEFLEERLNSVYKEKLEIEPLSFDELRSHLKGENENTLVVNAFSNVIVPVTPDAGPFTANVGPLADRYIASDWSPPTELVDFLDSCSSGTDKEPPICVGFGSMPFENASMIRSALKSLGVNAVLVGQALKSDDDGNGDKDKQKEGRIFQIDSVPYPWLLPKCSMMISHGGAGVVNATLRAGIPAVISPLMGDQMSWAALVQAKGLGVTCGTNLATLTQKEFIESIQKANECKVACREIALQVEAETTGPQVLWEQLQIFLSSPTST